MLLTAPLPRYLDVPVPPATVEAPAVPAPSRLRQFVSRFQTRYRLYRLCGWSRIAAVWTILRTGRVVD
jgi:hypothetical protein